MPASLIVAIYNAWDAITEWIGYFSGTPDSLQTLIFVGGCLMEFAFVLAPLLVFIGFFGWKKYAWYILMFLSLSNVVCSPLGNWISYDLATILGKCTGIGLDVIILLYYWKKRQLFNVNIGKEQSAKHSKVLIDRGVNINTSQAIAFCHKCGNKLASGSRFCNKCGTRIPTKEVE